jgi:DNA repair protein RecO (recombination protein O)
MEWTDEAIVLSVRAHGETASVVELLTRQHGRHLGLVHGGQSRRRRPVLQPGNQVAATWKGRLAEHLGQLAVEPGRTFAANFLHDPFALAGLTTIVDLARLLPERDPHPELYEVTLFVLGYLEEPQVWPALLVRWELQMLAELGFGLDLSKCAQSGIASDLVYVSPRSGRAVSREAGEPYRDRLLALPRFLLPRRLGEPAVEVAARDVLDGLTLTGHFLLKRALAPQGLELPPSRQRIAERLRAGSTSLSE